MQKIPQKAWIKQSKKKKNAKAPDPNLPGNLGHNEKTKPRDYNYRRE